MPGSPNPSLLEILALQRWGGSPAVLLIAALSSSTYDTSRLDRLSSVPGLKTIFVPLGFGSEQKCQSFCRVADIERPQRTAPTPTRVRAVIPMLSGFSVSRTERHSAASASQVASLACWDMIRADPCADHPAPEYRDLQAIARLRRPCEPARCRVPRSGTRQRM
jgi:hypothetical protein